MTWSPISLSVPQYVDCNGEPLCGAVLKAYRAGTTTPAVMATNLTGGITAASFALDVSGYPVSGGNIIIPHIDRSYKLVLYPNQVAADSDTGDLWTIDNLVQVSLADSGQVVSYGTVSDMVTTTALVIGNIVTTSGYISDGDGGNNLYEIVAAGTGTDDGGSFIDLSGTSLQAKGLFPSGVVKVKQFGAAGDGVTDDSTAFVNAVAYGQVVVVSESAGEYQVTGTFTTNKFLFEGLASTNNSTIFSYLWGGSSIFKVSGTNLQIQPIHSISKSFSHYHHHEGAANFWGGGTDGAAGLYAGLTIYGKDHPDFPQDIKLRSLNARPLWFKSQLETGGVTGTWSMGGFPLIEVGDFQCIGLQVNSSERRLRIDDADATFGDATPATFFELNHRNNEGYLQFCGGKSQGSGFTFRAYGGNTSGASTDAGMIMYADNVQQLRYRDDLNDFDYKGNTISSVSDERQKKNIEKLSAAEKACAKACIGLVRTFRYTDKNFNKNGKRVGVIAQELIATFEIHGLDAMDYAMLSYDEETDRFRISYQELMMFVMSAI